MRYDMGAQQTILTAAAKARSMGHSYVGSAHLLIALALMPGAAASLLRGAGVEPKLVEEMALVMYGMGTGGLPLPQGLSNQARKILRSAKAADTGTLERTPLERMVKSTCSNAMMIHYFFNNRSMNRALGQQTVRKVRTAICRKSGSYLPPAPAPEVAALRGRTL